MENENSNNNNNNNNKKPENGGDSQKFNRKKKFYKNNNNRGNAGAAGNGENKKPENPVKQNPAPGNQKNGNNFKGNHKGKPRDFQGNVRADKADRTERENSNRDKEIKDIENTVGTEKPQMAATGSASIINDTDYVADLSSIPEYDAEETVKTTQDDGTPKIEIVGVRFKKTGKSYFFAPNGIAFAAGDFAIVETARGIEYGEVAISNRPVSEKDIVQPLRPVIRKATAEDTAHNEENRIKEKDAFRICEEKIKAHGLDMKLVEAQYTFDNSKLQFYFTSAGRVDFRELVKDLASVFRIRIELRQIGIRDEAKLLGGLGVCGRPLCCTRFLSDFAQVSIKMAKEQGLSLNSAKISGICGRLMCCLNYEYSFYEDELKKLPPPESIVGTVDGNGTVTEILPLAHSVKVKLANSPDVPPKVYSMDAITVIERAKPSQYDGYGSDKGKKG